MRAGTGLERRPSHKVGEFSTELSSQTQGDLLMTTLSPRVWSSGFLQLLNVWSNGGAMGTWWNFWEVGSSGRI